jgi:hypothetical protein
MGDQFIKTMNAALDEIKGLGVNSIFYFNDEGDSNQTEFELRGNERYLGVHAETDRQAKIMLVFLRDIVDGTGDCIMIREHYTDAVEEFTDKDIENDPLCVFDFMVYQIAKFTSFDSVIEDRNEFLEQTKKNAIKYKRGPYKPRIDRMEIWTGQTIEQEIRANCEFL